ncbi:phytoene desaturase family protein [Alkalicoccus daliensis]|uniref:C-3',4' desaturase CrtD n=1 Tax=Alkalicoccus daliensis TaxID=745820 RepID=A0A1H0AMW4_9BACI|nr:NAD(P)/FAD-dependent oxidoreductase [Alkalicoccus daliensis]SDN34908.1 C-3',4' desaturase CrtD [Alkalicoccus daliensis]
MSKKIVIVGSGFAGVTAGALLQKQGQQVTLLEAAAEWGGSAGKFQRNKFRFPVGATLAMGFERNGVHDQINKYLNISVDISKLDKVMDIHLGNEHIPYYQNRKQFLRMWSRHIPEASERIEAFFKEVWFYASLTRTYMEHFPVLYPKRLHELMAVRRGFTINSLLLMPHIHSSLDKLVKKHRLEDETTFTQFLDSVLIDSMQTGYKTCSLLMGCTALDVYHRGVWYIKGGFFKVIEELIESLKRNEGTAKKLRRVTEIIPGICNGPAWLVKDHRGNEYPADEVILNMPIKNTKDLFPQHCYDQLKPHFKGKDSSNEQWGAFTLYLGTKDIFPADTPLFQQILVNPEGPVSAGNHFFVSISEQGDIERAPEGYRSITISTHIDLLNWNTKEEYDQLSEQIQETVLSILEKKFPGFTESVVHGLSGGPRAWERYTKRKGGAVGGFPQTPQNALQRAISHRTPLQGIWLCGDNVFPGAGSIGASSSGVHVARSILKDRIF